MTSEAGFNQACCTLPQVEANYKPKGEWTEVAGLKTYKVGPAKSKAAIILIYDVFLFTPQILQGADLLAANDNFQVFMPDFCKGVMAQREWFDGSEEGNKKKMEYFGPDGAASLGAAKENTWKVVEALKNDNSELERFGMMGYCWGGKIVSLAAVSGTPLHAAAEVHPALMDPSDGENITIPIMILPSKDEDAKVMKGFFDNVKPPKLLETFNEMPHGWMAARGDMENEPGKGEFRRGYQKAHDFFAQHLQASGSGKL